jgi:hypothetical protein
MPVTQRVFLCQQSLDGLADGLPNFGGVTRSHAGEVVDKTSLVPICIDYSQ